MIYTLGYVNPLHLLEKIKEIKKELQTERVKTPVGHWSDSNYKTRKLLRLEFAEKGLYLHTGQYKKDKNPVGTELRRYGNEHIADVVIDTESLHRSAKYPGLLDLIKKEKDDTRIKFNIDRVNDVLIIVENRMNGIITRDKPISTTRIKILAYCEPVAL